MCARNLSLMAFSLFRGSKRVQTLSLYCSSEVFARTRGYFICMLHRPGTFLVKFLTQKMSQKVMVIVNEWISSHVKGRLASTLPGGYFLSVFRQPADTCTLYMYLLEDQRKLKSFLGNSAKNWSNNISKAVRSVSVL